MRRGISEIPVGRETREGLFARIAKLEAERDAAFTALHFPGGHLRPGNRKPCHYVGSPCNKCGYVDPRDVRLTRYWEALEQIKGPCVGSKRLDRGQPCDCDPCIATRATEGGDVDERDK